MTTAFKYGGRTVNLVPTTNGFYCKWDTGETYITVTPESAVFLAEKMIEAPDIYGAPNPDSIEW